MKGKEFNVYFTASTIAKTQELYMKNLNANNVTSEHEKPVKGATVIESWIVEDSKNDKSNIYNLNAPVGSWVIMMKIYNDEEWQLVKDGDYKGFSIEGLYQGFEQLEASKQLTDDEKLVEEIKAIILEKEIMEDNSPQTEVEPITDRQKLVQDISRGINESMLFVEKE
jgi:hypothetical protein